jgi:hypothetical protein
MMPYGPTVLQDALGNRVNRGNSLYLATAYVACYP